MTYSIIAKDPDSGAFGIAVQTAWFGVGSIAPWTEVGVGAVATQSFVEVSYGPRGLDLMRAGKTAREALDALLTGDEGRETRQVAMIDAAGGIAVHTGSACVEAAGHAVGELVSCQANMMENGTVWDAMLEAYRDSSGNLAARMIAALEAAEGEGGDIRGRQSAAMLVVPDSGERWARSVDIRVEDDPDPVRELARLLRVQRAYEALNDAGDHAADRRVEDAKASYEVALELAPEDPQVAFWAGSFYATAGEVDRGRELLARARAADARWATFLKRAVDAGVIGE